MHTSLDLASVLVEILDFLEMYKQNLKPRQGFHKNRPDLDKGSAKDLLFRSRFLAMPQLYLANSEDCAFWWSLVVCAPKPEINDFDQVFENLLKSRPAGT